MIFTKARAALLASSLTALASIAGASAAQAATIVALQEGKWLHVIDTDAKKVRKTIPVAGNASLVGIDVRPSDGKLYGVTTDGSIVTVDAASGKWEKKSTLSEKLPAGATLSVDFNPVADRMRILSSTGMSLRVNVEDGKAIVDGQLKYAEGDANKGKTPKVVAGAYSNSYAGTKETALYDIDAASAAYLRQAPPNDGILNTLGKLTVNVGGPVAFDIASDGKGGNTGWLLVGGMLHSLDIATGATKSVGAIAGLKGKVSDISVMPAM
ncbi:MAG: DUF4394 domain-containing protein [Hyphomicrobiaceae bacterium]|nr:DUF4394 domain-containing protein [Hyphomicrobiaceae bacterium]